MYRVWIIDIELKKKILVETEIKRWLNYESKKEIDEQMIKFCSLTN